jgi:hypothetical protein
MREAIGVAQRIAGGRTEERITAIFESPLLCSTFRLWRGGGEPAEKTASA